MKIVGRSCGRVMCQNRCQPFAPSIIPASPSSTPTFCSAAMKRSMNVPLVVNTAMRMNADRATEGPASHSQRLTPSTSV